MYILIGRLTSLLTCTSLWKMSSWFPLLFIRSLTQSPTQLTLNSCHWYFSVTYRRRIPWVEFPSTLPWEGRLGAPPYQVSTSQPKPLTRQNTHDASDAYILPLHVAKAGLSKLNFFCKWTYLLQLWKISEIMVLQSTISSSRWPENCLLDGLIMSRSRQRKGDLASTIYGVSRLCLLNCPSSIHITNNFRPKTLLLSDGWVWECKDCIGEGLYWTNFY